MAPPKGTRPPNAGKGRVKGVPNKATLLRAAIAKDLPAIVKKLKEQAKAGDTTAARLLLERTLPPLKAAEQPIPLALPDGSLSDQGRAVLVAAGAGQLAPMQAAQLLAGLGALAKLIETDELAARVAALEERYGKP